MPRNNWTYEQDLAVLYAKITYGRDFNSHPDIQRLADAMGRTHAAIRMRKGNFDALDPGVEGIGLSKAAGLTHRVWQEYMNDPDETIAIAQGAYNRLLSS